MEILKEQPVEKLPLKEEPPMVMAPFGGPGGAACGGAAPGGGAACGGGTLRVLAGAAHRGAALGGRIAYGEAPLENLESLLEQPEEKLLKEEALPILVSTLEALAEQPMEELLWRRCHPMMAPLEILKEQPVKNFP
jgi:hypothetical protein